MVLNFDRICARCEWTVVKSVRVRSYNVPVQVDEEEMTATDQVQADTAGSQRQQQHLATQNITAILPAFTTRHTSIDQKILDLDCLQSQCV